ncbi:hypothetical protein C8A05DRAFT_45833 [Staphylotrichum tortipilum]|uniref:Uncharacterized protein n=1 Tax=Staphylotrichum tortipilum TaxID=2831512 RepID=A0AAN6RRH6_9PEZI|nr:hypothetical protein C8A05DRAFT_45833 [Staphylotrichum longicolle]
MSADALPISPTAFALALPDLPLSALHLKVLELRNSIAHLDYSNEQLRPFAEGTAVALSSLSSPTANPATDPSTITGNGASTGTTENVRCEPDAECLEAIAENNQVIERMQTRIRLVREEVERRGLSWAEFSSQGEDKSDETQTGEAVVNGASTSSTTSATQQQQQPEAESGNTNSGGGERHSAWSDGTFQTGVIRGGVAHLDTAGRGGSLTDEELRRRVEEQLRGLGGEEEEEGEGGLHL